MSGSGAAQLGTARRRESAPEHDAQDPQDAFDAFFTRHMAPLYGYVRRLVPLDDAASDITQETFFRAWTHYQQISCYARPEAWLYRVATNLAMSYLRKRTPLSLSRLGRQTQSVAPPEAMTHTDDLEIPLAFSLDLEESAAERDHINRVLFELPERQRAVLLLRAAHGFSYAEIAAMLDIAVPNVYQLLSRACKRFREWYELSAHDHMDEQKKGEAR